MCYNVCISFYFRLFEKLLDKSHETVSFAMENSMRGSSLLPLCDVLLFVVIDYVHLMDIGQPERPIRLDFEDKDNEVVKSFGVSVDERQIGPWPPERVPDGWCQLGRTYASAVKRLRGQRPKVSFAFDRRQEGGQEDVFKVVVSSSKNR